MISSVPKQHRAYANSMGAIFLNLLGYLPAPFLYGLVDELTSSGDKVDNNKSRYGMVVLMSWSVLGAISLAVAVLARSEAYCFKRGKAQQKKEKLLNGDTEIEKAPSPPRVIPGHHVLNESEDDDERGGVMVPDSGSTEQQMVRSAMNDEGDYYDEQRVLIER